MVSNRFPSDLSVNPIARALLEYGPPEYDLTVSNPTVCGLPYPPGLLAPLGDHAGLRYSPEPRGLPQARGAIAREHARHGAQVDPSRIVLTASTSEAYGYLFKLLCSPGEAVLAPAPSYPLLEHLARAEGVVIHPYRLDPDDGWRLNLADIVDAPATVRAVIVVHPNNPTGSFVHPEDAQALEATCAERGWALIADEVFLDYPLDGVARPSFAGQSHALTFVLGGLSKSVGLPQLKLAWIVTAGPDAAVAGALQRLDLIADTYLSVGTPVQLAATRLLADGATVRTAIQQRIRDNLEALASALSLPSPTSLLAPEGGWSAAVRFPAVVSEEWLAIELLRRDSVAVHPGFFFDFAREATLVVSLLPRPDVFNAGLARLTARIDSLL